MMQSKLEAHFWWPEVDSYLSIGKAQQVTVPVLLTLLPFAAVPRCP